MAPTAPKKRPSIRAKTASKPTVHAPPAHRPGAIISPSFINSKKDKQTIKSQSFLSRITKSHTKPLKRRRPNKKLVANLEGLADALPDVESLIAQEKGSGMVKKAKSLGSKPGVLKRKEKLERVERERFGRNLAQIMGVKEVAATTTEPMVEGQAPATQITTTSRFAALRAFAEATMEKHPGFVKTKE